MKNTQLGLMQGTLDLLVFKTPQAGPARGWDIAQRIQQISRSEGKVLQTVCCRPETAFHGDGNVETFYRGGRIDSENLLKRTPAC
jgi:hypothetical protein